MVRECHAVFWVVSVSGGGMVRRDWMYCFRSVRKDCRISGGRVAKVFQVWCCWVGEFTYQPSEASRSRMTRGRNLKGMRDVGALVVIGKLTESACLRTVESALPLRRPWLTSVARSMA